MVGAEVRESALRVSCSSLEDEEESTSRGMQVPLGAGKARNRLFLGAPRRNASPRVPRL